MRHCLFGLLMAASVTANAEIQTQEIPYTAADGTDMIGYYAYDDSIEGKRPGIVVVHEWWGLNDYAKQRASATSPSWATAPWPSICTAKAGIPSTPRTPWASCRQH